MMVSATFRWAPPRGRPEAATCRGVSLRLRGQPEADGEDAVPPRRRPGTPAAGQTPTADLYSGSAGIGDFFLSYYEVTREANALAFARRMTDQILARATRDASGTRWIHAENRTQPENLAAQTGWMQGAAGIGAWLIRLDGFDRGRAARIVLPDSPFGR